MKFSEWEHRVLEMIRADVIWKMKVYRMSMFLADISREDVFEHRGQILTEIIKLLLTIVPKERNGYMLEK